MSSYKIVLADLHIGAPHALNIFPIQIYKNLQTRDYNSLPIECRAFAKRHCLTENDLWLLGDIFDLNNCKKNLVSYYRDLTNHYIKLFKNNYLTGNHELTIKNLQHMENGILKIHGDAALYSINKFLYWRDEKKPGKNEWARFWIGVKHKSRKLKSKSVSKKALIKIANFAADKNCHHVIIGHAHPSKIIDSFVRTKKHSIRVTVVPRGISCINAHGRDK